VSGSNSRRCTQFAFSLAVAIERHCSVDANHAQRDALARPDGPEVEFFLNNFELFRAHLNKRAALTFHKANRRSNVRNARGPGFSGHPVAEHGAATRGVLDARAIGPRNAIERS